MNIRRSPEERNTLIALRDSLKEYAEYRDLFKGPRGALLEN